MGIAAPPAVAVNGVNRSSPADAFEIKELIGNVVEAYREQPAGTRINLVIPGVSAQWRSGGGPATALRLFEELCAEFEFCRIILTHQCEADLELHEWPGWSPDRGRFTSRVIAFLGERTVPLQVAYGDLFLATFWSTAVYVKHVIARQRALLSTPERRFAYLIQDYEPAFYAWSARYAYARSTYNDTEGVIAVFNSTLLAHYFRQIGLHFSEQYVFEPMLNPALREKRDASKAIPKEKIILVYGRPSVARNDFDFVVEVLRIWARTYSTAQEWVPVSAGESHGDVELASGIVLKSVGKSSLDEYSTWLARCSVGLSFMFSPHPSYPPLEMAEFGAWVVTNPFENKNLAKLSRKIVSIDDATPEAAARSLAWCCDQYRPGDTVETVGGARVFADASSEFPFVRGLANSWRAV